MNTLLEYSKYRDSFRSFTHVLRFIFKKAAVPPPGLITVSAMLPPTYNRITRIGLQAGKHLFLILVAAMAGYNPQEAIPFWERMSNAGGASPPDFLSTHPSDATRIRKLKQFMPEAMKYYNQAK